MVVLQKWRKLPKPERRLTVRALPLVAGVRLALWVLPWRVTRRVTQRLSVTRRAPAGGAADADVDAVARAVARVARRVPRATCLTQAIAASVMLGRRGLPASIRFGAARDAGGRFVAHAWVESRGRVVLGGVTSPQRYASFPAVVVSGKGRAIEESPANSI